MLTVTAGAVDATAFLGLGHAFAALATGNLLLLGFAAAGAQDISLVRPLLALAGFTVGAAVGDAAVDWLRDRGRRWFVLALLLEAAFLWTAAGYALSEDAAGRPDSRQSAVVFLLVAFAMGWRNRVTWEARIPDMPTTLVQMSLVKMVVDAMSLGRGGGGPAMPKVRRLATVVGMFAGGVCGAALVLNLGVGPALGVIAGSVTGTALLYAVGPWLRPPAARPPDSGWEGPGSTDPGPPGQLGARG
ncbi:YoaK family protein [Kitasatospora camelliae]|uniref:YoaK family protein n=1 Tax=Kitasatospora camelliae TaxID=3156397 RepID=A0AAU8K6Z0_9ACTN